MKKFSDFATDDGVLTGDKLKLEEILGKNIIVKGYKISDSKYCKSGEDKKVLTLQFELEGVDYIIFTGSKVLMDQVEKYKDEIPLTPNRKGVFFCLNITRDSSITQELITILHLLSSLYLTLEPESILQK